MRQFTLRFVIGMLLLPSSFSDAQTSTPVVTMTIAPAGEKPSEVKAPESGLVRITIKGTEFGFRPTIEDSTPWTRVTVTIFRMDPTVEPLGQVEVKTGGPTGQSKTKPSFTIGVTKVVPGDVNIEPIIQIRSR